MASGVLRAKARCKTRVPTEVGQAFEKIDILEPNRVESLVHAVRGQPGLAADQQAGARRLIDIDGAGEVEMQAAIPLIDRAASPDPVQAQYFKNESCGGREVPHLKAALRDAARVDEQSGGSRYIGLSEFVLESGWRLEEHYIRIQDEYRVGSGGVGEALIHSGGEAEVGAVGKDGDGGATPDVVQRIVGGCVVDNEDAGHES